VRLAPALPEHGRQASYTQKSREGQNPHRRYYPGCSDVRLMPLFRSILGTIRSPRVTPFPRNYLVEPSRIGRRLV